MKRICVIIPYFGRWPAYLDLFLHACHRNPILNVLFLTDLKPPAQSPDNVRFHYVTIDQIRRSIKDLVGIEAMITKPYKLCDIKPAYGLIFQDYIRDFDFWGYGDIDLVYGDLSRWLTAEALSSDVISFRKKWLSGSLALFRNNEKMNRLFLESPDVKMVFESAQYLGFDEVSGCWREIRTMPIEKISFPYDNFTRVVFSAIKAGRIKGYLNDHAKESILADDYLMLSRDGRVVDRNGTEYAYYHYITEKGKFYFRYPKWRQVPDQYVINRTGFYILSEFRNHRIIGKWRKMRATPLMVKDLLRRAYRKVRTL
jgi:hypothetical protein